MTLAERLNQRVLGIWPNSRGFGYVMFEDPRTLVEWGLPRQAPEEEPKALACLRDLLRRLRPHVLVVESTADPKCRRKDRVRRLLGEIGKTAQREGVALGQVAKTVVESAFRHVAKPEKHPIARYLAASYPELAPRLPPARRPWDSEDVRMSLFAAAALAIAYYEEES